MDKYTKKNRIWLNNRFKYHDGFRIYHSHQPIYGFRKGHSELGLNKYICTYQIMKALSHLKFNSLLDVGGAEGYKAFIVNQLFGVKVKNSDLSEEACKRAKEIFHIESITVDIHDLPFKNNEFDAVLCSDTLEHVVDLHKAINQLIRVANKAVIITVPHEPMKMIEKNYKEKKDHAHIHSFDLESFNYLNSYNFNFFKKKMISSLLKIPAVLIEAMPRENCERLRFLKSFLKIYNARIPFLRKTFSKSIAVFLIQLDDFICKFTSSYDAILFIILKNIKYWSKEEIQNISVSRIINFSVPYYYLKKNN